MKRAQSLFIISLFTIFLLSPAKSMAQLKTPHDYFGDAYEYNLMYFFSPFITNPWMSKSFFNNSFEFPNYNQFSCFSYPESNHHLYSLFPATSPISNISAWAGFNDTWGYRLSRSHSSTDPCYTLPILYTNVSNFSGMFGQPWNLFHGYINLIQNKVPGNQCNNDASKLVNKPWKLESFGIIGEEEPLIPGTEITIQFDKDKTYQGNAGCNDYFGTYEASNNNELSISPPGSTDMACNFPEGIMQQEYEYLDQILGNVCSFEIDQDKLKLYYDNKQKVLNFILDDNYAYKLVDKFWKLQSFGTVGEEKSVICHTIIGLQFSEDNKFEGNAGCNDYFGTYEASNEGDLSISLTGFTEKACSFPQGIMEQEEEYLEALEGVCSFEICQDYVNLFRNELKLFYDDGHKVLNFVERGSIIIPEWIHMTYLIRAYQLNLFDIPIT